MHTACDGPACKRADRQLARTLSRVIIYLHGDLLVIMAHATTTHDYYMGAMLGRGHGSIHFSRTALAFFVGSPQTDCTLLMCMHAHRHIGCAGSALEDEASFESY